VPAGTDVLIRFRTYHNDVTDVKLRVYDINAGGQTVIPMSLAASDVSCYQDGLPYTCDFWQADVKQSSPNNLWYRFIVTDGTKTVYYADNTPALDGGLGSPSDSPQDYSYALMFYDPAFSAPTWAKGASIYQIFPDRFRDGRGDNNPHTGDIRYDDPVLKLNWGTLPEGYCRNYAGADSTNCPWRFDDSQPADTKEGPRGRDYFGGDLRGVDQNLDYLKSLGVNTLYFNPIFDSGSNHGYDTQDYKKIDPYFGTQKDFDNLIKHANQLGIRIVLDGVFNHMSSDSPIFDRYHHYATVGACESADSPYRAWFHFRKPTGNEPSVCAPSTPGGDDTYYDGWFGFDSIPVINKSLPDVQQYFLTAPDSVSKFWLNKGASGWRLDVMGDSSFPNGYWETFRQVVKSTKSDALIISETWQKDSTLLRMLRGDRADTTMNYRLRDAVIGLLVPQNGFDSKGFADSGHILTPSEFAARMESMREDYPDAAYYSLMNLLDSHDTERLRWTLTPGTETTADKEQNSDNVKEGKTRQQLASLIQFTVPGAPTVYYGDEVGVTGDDDPDDRRTYPWADKGGTPDQSMFNHYKALNTLRSASSALVNGDFKMLLADDATGVVAYGRKFDNQAAVVIVNPTKQSKSGAIPVAGYLPDGVTLNKAYAVGTGSADSVSVVDGAIQGSLGPLSAVVFLTGTVDLKPAGAPAGLQATAGAGQVSLTWNGVAGAVGYNVYRSPLSGGGYIKVNDAPVSQTTFTDSSVQNAHTYYYVVTSLDNAGNESKPSNEVSALPHLTIGWANLQWPSTLTHVISAVNRTDNVYGQVWINGATDQPGATEGLIAQLGYGPLNSDPQDNPDWIWVDASFNTDVGNNDEFVASLLPEQIGTFGYTYRYSTTNGVDWFYAVSGPGGSSNPIGTLTVTASDDTTPPAAPANLHAVSASPAGIELAWDAVMGDATLYGYEVLRSTTPGSGYEMVGRVTSNAFTDLAIVEGTTYYYVVRSVDNSFNRSGNSNEVQAIAELRTVSVTFNVTVPASTDGTGKAVYIAGTLSRLDGGLPDWNPSGVVLTRVDATHWTITLTGKEYTQIEYKYALGDWNFVEKDGACGEIGNRQLTLTYGSDGTQTVNDTVLNWRNVSPCGN
jgi:glycosidase/fibronectin type 3 domain-containing protein